MTFEEFIDFLQENGIQDLKVRREYNRQAQAHTLWFVFPDDKAPNEISGQVFYVEGNYLLNETEFTTEPDGSGIE